MSNEPLHSRREFTAALGALGCLAISGGLATAADERIRVGVIGHTGHGDYGHGLDSMWLRLPETEIVGLADADPKGLAAEQKKLSLKQGFADYRKMLAETKPEIVAIACRNIDQHHAMALAAIESGAKGIYMEKPFCPTAAQADEIIAACERGNVKLAIAHRNRYNQVVPVVDQMLKDETIGRLLEVRARGKEDARGGPQDLWVLGSHVLNLATHFTGRPLACTGALFQDGKLATRKDVREGTEGVGLIAGNEVHARFEMESGVPVFFDSIAKAGNSAAGFGLQLVGTKGIIDLRMDTQPIAHLLAGNPFQPVKDPRAWVPITSAGSGKGESDAELGKQVMAHLVGARDLMAAIRENRQPLCSAFDGRITVEMVTAVFESHRLNGARVSIPVQTRDNPLAKL